MNTSPVIQKKKADPTVDANKNDQMLMDMDTAGSQLQELRKRCPGCEIPDSLEDF